MVQASREKENRRRIAINIYKAEFELSYGVSIAYQSVPRSARAVPSPWKKMKVDPDGINSLLFSTAGKKHKRKTQADMRFTLLLLLLKISDCKTKLCIVPLTGMHAAS